MKILITGITGLFGSYLAREFFALGEIHGFKRENSDTALIADMYSTIIWHEGDVADYESIERALPDIDLVIHAAGMVSFQSADQEKLLKVNVEGTANMVNAMLEKGIKRLIHISSVSAIGRSGDNLTINETQKWTTSPLNTAYSISKYLGELEVWRGAQEGLEVLVVNPSVLLAKVSDKRSSSGMYQYVIDGNKFYPKGYINYIDIRDAAALTLELFKRGMWNERFILNKESISYQDFFAQIASKVGKKSPKWAVSNKFLGIVSTYFKIKSLFVSTPFNKEAAQTAQLKISFDNSKINKLINPPYRRLEDTLNWATGNEN
ncbi:MAG TPA: NAD-dependent epimerase/dehydratase family protein [Anditalea sp.]|nr:NAD-dependent epimerase/dehydratase family protein [Anditalea sp.]